MGTFNFLDMALHPITGDLWLVNDCANIGCTVAGGGSLWTVNKLTGTATPVQTFGTSLGQLTALAISPEGKFFVASFSSSGFSSIYEIDPITGKSTFITDTGLASLSILNDMAFNPSTNRLYGIEERRGAQPRTWYLVEVTGLPSPVTPFAAFTAQVEIRLGPRTGSDAFQERATFTLGAASDGINPPTEAVSFQIGTFSTTIPARSFHAGPRGQFTFEGVINGVTLEVRIAPQGDKSFIFQAEGTNADLSGTTNPVTVMLTIGDDSGTISVTAEIQ